MSAANRIYYIVKLKCPSCHKGNIFMKPGLFVLSGPLKMPEKCSHCHQDFKIEPGFYSAALWISYPIVLLVFIPMLFFGFYLNATYKISPKLLVPIFVIVAFLLQIPIMRVSRAILLHVTIRYCGGGNEQ